MPRLDVNPPLHVVSLFARRWLLAALLVFGAYNPSGNSYYHWISSTESLTTTQICVGILLLTGLVTIARMAFLSIGYFGVAAISLMVLMGITFGVGLGFFGFQDVEITTYLVLFWIALVLGVGTSWSFVQKRLSGERDVLRSPP
jgi:hypothetical protein